MRTNFYKNLKLKKKAAAAAGDADADDNDVIYIGQTKPKARAGPSSSRSVVGTTTGTEPASGKKRKLSAFGRTFGTIPPDSREGRSMLAAQSRLLPLVLQDNPTSAAELGYGPRPKRPKRADADCNKDRRGQVVCMPRGGQQVLGFGPQLIEDAKLGSYVRKKLTVPEGWPTLNSVDPAAQHLGGTAPDGLTDLQTTQVVLNAVRVGAAAAGISFQLDQAWCAWSCHLGIGVDRGKMDHMTNGFPSDAGVGMGDGSAGVQSICPRLLLQRGRQSCQLRYLARFLVYLHQRLPEGTRANAAVELFERGNMLAVMLMKRYRLQYVVANPVTQQFRGSPVDRKVVGEMRGNLRRIVGYKPLQKVTDSKIGNYKAFVQNTWPQAKGMGWVGSR